MRTYGLYIHGQYVPADSTLDARSPYGDPAHRLLARCAFLEKDEELVQALLEGASETFKQIQKGFFPLAERLAFLERFKEQVSENAEALAQSLCLEIAKPLDLARGEVKRCLQTLDWTLKEAPLFFKSQGLAQQSVKEWQNLEAFSFYEGRGPLFAISPFNFPLNLSLHKVAPALAAGCPVILKPSPKAALSSLALADLFQAAALPAGMLSVIQCSNEVSLRILKDPRVKQFSFTGSAFVGPKLAQEMGALKSATLELGGTAPVYIDAEADLDLAAQKMVEGAFAYAGQVCISVQNIFIHKKIAGSFKEKLREEISKLKWGSARESGILSSCVIDEAAQKRLEATREGALKRGAKIIAEAPALNGNIEGPFVRPAFFEGLPFEDPFIQEEVFGPYAHVFEVDGFDDFVSAANSLPARLQTSIFSGSLKLGLRAIRELDYGGVLVNESPSFRMDPMPYGGRGLAGFGREGPRYALESFCDLKTAIIRP